jgi:gamma-glutamyltranspeptidase/glutathione hydrolase
MMTLSALLDDAAATAQGGRAAWLAAGGDGLAAQVPAQLMAPPRAADAPQARHGAIATGAPAATRIGMQVLADGGTAADAAVAAAMAIMVADPPNASVAGRGHILWAREGMTPEAIDGATAAPPDLPPGLTGLPDAQALPLPGILRALLRLHRRAGRLPLARLAAPARDLARDGFVVPDELARVWAWRAPEIADPDARRVYLPLGRPPEAGTRFRNPALATVFDRLIATGQDPFADPGFAGPLAARLAAKGAYWTPAALAAADPLDGETVSLAGAGWRLTSIGRQGWGDTLLRIVALQSSVDPRTPCEAELVHLLAILCAFEERPQHLRSLKPKTDPLPWDVLRDRLTDPLRLDWSAQNVLRQAIDRAGLPELAEERDTTHLSVVDAQGMRVALTQSIGPHFGSRVADPETGMLLAHSYRMAHDPAPGARDVTEQCPSLLDTAGASYALGGAGSERIPGAVAAVLRHLLAGRDLAQAMAAPRANWVGATARLHIDVPQGLETRLADAGVTTAFTGRGPVDHLGIVQAACRRADRGCAAAADPAYSGSAAAG